METKTYKYLHGGVIQSVEVTFAQGNCPVNGYGQFKTNITATIPAAIGVDLYVDVKQFLTIRNYNSSGDYINYLQILIPAGQTKAVKEVLCYEEYENEDYTETYEYTYTLEDQKQETPPDFAITYTKVDASCFGAINGSISVAVSGGTPDFAFSWSDGGPAVALRTGLSAGSYSVTVTDASGIIKTINDIVIAQPTQIAAAFTVVDNTCFGATAGSITATVSGGSGGYKYGWSDGSATLNRYNLSSGGYQLRITDSSGCSRVFNVNVAQPPQIKITSTIEGRNVTISVAGGVTPYRYFWDDNVTVKDRVNLADGTYAITVRDANNCQASATIIINTFKFYFSKNPVWLMLQADELASKPNLSFKCDVLLEDIYKSELFTTKYSTEHPARLDGSTDFDMQEVLNAYLSSNVPGFGESNPLQVLEAFKRFYLRHSEVFGEPPVQAPYTQVETYYVLFGGLSEQEFAKKTFFNSYLDDEKPFLTWQPRTKEVITRQHEYLHYVVVNAAISELNLWVKVKFADGSEMETLLKTVTNVRPYEVYRFPAGYLQLNLGSLSAGSAVVAYTLYLKSGLEVVSELRNYRVVTAQPHYKVYLYLNSLGGWDTLLAKGKGKNTIRTSEEVIERELPAGYAYHTRAKEVTSKTGQKTGQVVVGNLTVSEKKHLADFAISEQVYEQTLSGYLPVTIKFNFDESDDMNQLDEEVNFDVIYPATNRFTPEL